MIFFFCGSARMQKEYTEGSHTHTHFNFTLEVRKEGNQSSIMTTKIPPVDATFLSTSVLNY